MSNYKLVPLEPTPAMVEAAEEAYMPFGDMDLAIRMAVLTAPAVQGEPVAWYLPSEGGFDSQFRDHATVISCTGNPWEGWLPLYTAPQPVEQQVIPNEHGKNRYGLDMSYFRQLFNRELNRPLVDFKPSELARVLARASRTADPKVMHETEFQIAEQKPAVQQPELAKYQPCGCVVCTCEHETQCQGCGAKHCNTHLVGQIPGPVYQQPAPDVSALVEALKWLRGAINCTPENDKNQSGTWISTSHPRIRQIDELLAAHRKGGEA